MLQRARHIAALVLVGLVGVICADEEQQVERTCSNTAGAGGEGGGEAVRCEGEEEELALLQRGSQATRSGAAAATDAGEDFWTRRRRRDERKVMQVLNGEGKGSKDQWDKASKFAKKNIKVKRISSSKVASELAYAKESSNVPSSLHGIFWLDQFHQSSIAKGEEYNDKVPFEHPPSDETLAAFGDDPTVWDPHSRCVGPAPGFGGAKGHWTVLDTVGGKFQLDSAISSKMTAMFCLDETMKKIEVVAGIRLPVIHTWAFVPEWLFAMRMEKTTWGWNRVTTVGANISGTLQKYGPMMEKFLPESIMSILRIGTSGAFQYPVLPIIDGKGRKTKYFTEYMKYVTGWHNSNKTTQILAVQED